MRRTDVAPHPVARYTSQAAKELLKHPQSHAESLRLPALPAAAAVALPAARVATQQGTKRTRPLAQLDVADVRPKDKAAPFHVPPLDLNLKRLKVCGCCSVS